MKSELVHESIYMFNDKQILMKKLTLLGALLCATAMQAQTTYYWPGTRVDELTSGQQYFIYNTAVNGDRSWFVFSDGSALKTNNTSPMDFVTNENKYLFTLTKPENSLSDNHWYMNSIHGIVGVGGQTNNTEIRDVYITPWYGHDNISKADVQSEDESGVARNPDEVDTKVFAITKINGLNPDPNDKSYAWNGNDVTAPGEGAAWNKWSLAHPYAFYTVESTIVDPVAETNYQNLVSELTSRNGNLANLAFSLQNAFGLVQDGSKYYSNYKSSKEGSYEALVDGNDETYFHSGYDDEVGPEGVMHYLQAELPEATTDFYIITKRRTQNNNNRPTSILVQGCNEAEGTYTDITTLSGLPTAENDYFYFSDKITSKTGEYKYIRFTPQANTRFFTYSEFYIIKSTPESDAAMAAVKKLYDDKDDKVAAIKDKTFNDIFLNLDAATILQQQNLTAKKVEANNLIEANANNYADDPELGQYPTTAYNTFKDAVSASQNATDLAAAIKTFKFSINAPVFLINGAFNGGYTTSDHSIYYDANNDSQPMRWDKATNKYDRTMLWKFAGLTSTEPVLNTNCSVMNLAAQVYLLNTEKMQITETNPANTEDNIVLIKPMALNPVHADSHGYILSYNATGATTASAWTLEYVGESYDIEKITDDQLADYAALQNLINECEPFENKIGDGVNEFTSEGFEAAFAAAEEVLENGGSETEVTEALENLEEAKEALKINQPEPGFYRIKSISKKKYISSTPAAETDSRQSLVDEADETTVFYLSADHRLTNSLGINLNAEPRPAGNSLGATFDFQINNNGYYMIMIQGNGGGNNKPLFSHHDPNNGDLVSYDFNDGPYADKLEDAWTLEPVTETADQPVITKVMAADYATIAAPVALNIPAGVTAYTVKVEGEVAKLIELSGVIPAGVPAVVKGTEGTTYEFTFAPDGSTTNENDLQGVYVETEIPAETVAYVLAKGTQGVGFYLLSDEDRTLAANKAYLVLPAGTENVKAFILNTGDLTGIESVATGAEVEEYYDLQGRRVMKPTKGIYVTKSGKKVIF